MMSIMESVLCEVANTPGSLVPRATSSAPPWADMNTLTGFMSSSPDGGHSDATSNSSYVISSSGLIDAGTNSRMMPGLLCGDMETRDSSPQSTSFDGYDHHMMTHQQIMMKKHGNKPHRDPTSHRIIEKRRRDRMNNCLTNLSKLIPSAYLKKGRGRIEKTEIIEMAIRYMKHIELERRQKKRDHMELQDELMLDKSVGTDEDEKTPNTIMQHVIQNGQDQSRTYGERYRQGFFDCIAETLRFLAGAEGLTVNDQMKTRLLFHLREYFGRLADYECQYQSNIHQASSNIGHDRPEDSDEPLNMSIKRPRTSATPASRYQQQAPELPSSSSVSSGELRHPHHGSQLRDILETKEPQYASILKPEPQSMHLPHSTVPPMFIQQKFNTSATVSEQKQHVNGIGSTVADCNRSVSGLFSASSLGGRSTSSSNATTTSQYPSSPGSSVNSFVMESPPGLHSPPSPHNSNGFAVPIFALHPIGLFYVPLTVNSHVLDATFNASVTLCNGIGDHGSNHSSNATMAQQIAATAMSSVTHPVTINVNFNFLPNLANAVTQNQSRSSARIGHGSNHNGVILNTASFASNLRLALKP